MAATLNHSAGRVVSLYEKQVAYNRWAKSVRNQELLHHPAISNNGGCKAIAEERALQSEMTAYGKDITFLIMEAKVESLFESVL